MLAIIQVEPSRFHLEPNQILANSGLEYRQNFLFLQGMFSTIRCKMQLFELNY